jgi:hypothetical protein
VVFPAGSAGCYRDRDTSVATPAFLSHMVDLDEIAAALRRHGIVLFQSPAVPPAPRRRAAAAASAVAVKIRHQNRNRSH